MTYYIYSTATCDNIFPVYQKKARSEDMNIIKHKILIKGGANLATKQGFQGGNIWTPLGVRTELSDEDYDVLKDRQNFKMMVEHGFLKVEKKKMNPEKVAKEMTQKDESAPISPKDYVKTDNGTWKFLRDKRELTASHPF